MNSEIKAKWVAALRSGKYSQTAIRLTNGEGAYCCLGVLCEVARLDENGPEGIKYSEDSGAYSTGPFDASSAYLPTGVQNWAGLPDTHGSFNVQFDDEGLVRGWDEVRIPRTSPEGSNADIVGVSLSQLNDRGATFEEIAKVIEEHF